jgi:acyl-[acyl-carrier-protein]-phospholipid O-acyltransferase/long-chain-fatty-acid--[acyl-carrier-protein] ligase
MASAGRSWEGAEPRGAAVRRGLLRGIYEEGFRWLFKLYFGGVHRVRIDGMEHVPRDFHKLIVIANHASLIDGLLIWTYLRLPFKIIVDRTVARKPLFRPFTRNRHIVQIDFMNPYSLKEVIRWVSEGTPLLIFPEGRMTKTGSFMKIYEGTGFVALRTGAEVLPLYLKNTYKTFFAKKHPGRRFFAPITITVGRLRPPISLDHLPPRGRKQEATRIIARMLSETYVDAHSEPSTLGREFIRKCRENRGKPLFDDVTGHGVTYRRALVAAFVLGRYLSRFKERQIGLMLPNLTVTALIFMGLQLFRKIPALLNYSSGPRALQHAMELADLGVVVTSRAVLERMRLSESVFCGRPVIFLEDLKGLIRFRDKVRGLARSIFPGAHREIGADEHRETACILFTSGSEGMPKGVCLSHENLITNVYQALSRIDVTERDYFFNALPLFHSFGLTVGALIPPFLNARAFFYVSPLHYRIVPELAYQQGCTILCGTNAFLKGYGRRANAYDFSSMHYIFCGAEPLSNEVFEQYAKKFGIRVMAGYGLTECSPMVSMTSALEYAYGTVGTVLPGIEYKLVPVEGIDDKRGTVGALFVRGKNAMKGYLKNEKANHKYLVEDEGWYDTGDVVELTGEGFLKIVGRLKRFAKISGEMISLTAVEEALTTAFGDRRPTAVIARADEQRGERLVVVTSNPDVDLKVVREKLRQKGFSDLASPRGMLFMKEIPRLGSGKIDYVRLSEMVQGG